MVSKKKVKTKKILGKKVASFDWKWVRNSAPREGQKMPCMTIYCVDKNSVDPDQLASDEAN